MKPNHLLGPLACLALFAVACGRDSHAATHESVDMAAAPPPQGACGHAACGNNFAIDVAQVGTCTPGETCTVAIKLVATGDYHINDEYPYKFQADDAPGVEFLGTEGAGKNVFSKLAKNWTKNDDKTGTMSVTFKASGKGEKSVGGLFKLSVCSAQNCQLEREAIKVTVAVR
jgi:hypothetical protein